MGLAERTSGMLDWWRTRGKQRLLLFAATAIVMIMIAACDVAPVPPAVTAGKIVEKQHTEDVEVKKDVCVKHGTKKVKKNGKWKTVKVCTKTQKKEIELTPDIYQFKLKDGKNEGWVSVDEDTFNQYDKGDQYP